MTQQFQGRFSKGQTPTSAIVGVVLTGYGLSICDENGTELAVWLYEDLRPGSPIRKSDTDLLLQHAHDKHVTLFLEGPGVAKALIAHAPQISTQRQRMATLRYSMVGAFVFALLVGPLFFSKYEFSRSVAEFIPFSIADKIGERSARSLEESPLGKLTRKLTDPTSLAASATCDDPAGRAALQKIIDRLQNSGDYGPPFKVHVSPWTMENAFALPGRHIVVMSGLLHKANSPEEVAGILAHEMGHGLEKHPETGLVRGMGISVLLQLFAGQSTGDPVAVGATLLQLRYSRGAESSADEHAVNILLKAHISSKDLAAFFERHPSTGASLQYFSTHPASSDRARLFASQAPYATTPILTDQEWKAVQSLCAASQPSAKSEHNPVAQERPRN